LTPGNTVVPPLPPGHTGLAEQASGPALAGAAGPTSPVQGGIPKMQAIASTSDAAPGSPRQAQAATQPNQSRSMPPLQLVNDPEIILEYEVQKVGPSGLKSVEVWLTRDGGASWQIFAEDDKAAEMTSGGKYVRTLRLPQDGVYGLSLVVKSKAGLGRPAPRAGELPEMLVEVDTVAPEGTLYSPTPDTSNRNTLILSWIAKDRNLGKTPITLEWAEQPSGAWQPIATNQPNSGSYAWKLPPALPSHVYLKMTMRDEAGNVGVAVTSQPQLVDLSEPEGHITRVTTTANKKQ